jgi:hypothetical protein
MPALGSAFLVPIFRLLGLLDRDGAHGAHGARRGHGAQRGNHDRTTEHLMALHSRHGVRGRRRTCRTLHMDRV